MLNNVHRYMGESHVCPCRISNKQHACMTKDWENHTFSLNKQTGTKFLCEMNHENLKRLKHCHTGLLHPTSYGKWFPEQGNTNFGGTHFPASKLNACWLCETRIDLKTRRWAPSCFLTALILVHLSHNVYSFEEFTVYMVQKCIWKFTWKYMAQFTM